MISLNKTKKINLLLMLIIGAAILTSTVNQLSALPKNPTAHLMTCALAIGIPSFIRLYTKSTPKELKFVKKLDDPCENNLCDWFKILKVWNIIFHPYEYLKLVDKRWIGTPLKVLDQETKEISKDGLKEVTTTGKKLECLHTGVCGKFDFYVLKQLKKLYVAIGNIEKALIVYCLLHGYDIEKLAEVWLPKKA